MKIALLLLAALLLPADFARAVGPVAQITGMVLDPSGRPVAGAVVALRYRSSEPTFNLINHFPPVLSGADGKFSLPVYEWAEGLKVLGWKSGFAPTDSAVVTVQAPQAIVRLELGTVVTFQIMSGKEPIDDALICYAETDAYVRDESQRHLLAMDAGLLTSAHSSSGKAEIHVRPGKHLVGVSARGFQWLVREITVSERDSTERISLAPANDVRGRVVRHDGSPAAGMELRVRGPNSTGSQPLTTGADGSFLLP